MLLNGILIVALAVSGMVAWTFGEYVLHRFLMHELRGTGMPSREHLLHHVDPETNAGRPILSWIGIFVVGAVLFLVPGLWLFGTTVGWATYVGWVLGYGIYEQIHNRSHTHGPRGAYGRWVRRHHFHHHHGHPLTNHGVTTPFWDRIFGTYETPTEIRVPRRHAMRWLVTAGGEVRPEFSGLYRLVGPADRSARLAAIDRARAFANLAPT